MKNIIESFEIESETVPSGFLSTGNYSQCDFSMWLTAHAASMRITTAARQRISKMTPVIREQVVKMLRDAGLKVGYQDKVIGYNENIEAGKLHGVCWSNGEAMVLIIDICGHKRFANIQSNGYDEREFFRAQLDMLYSGQLSSSGKSLTKTLLVSCCRDTGGMQLDIIDANESHQQEQHERFIEIINAEGGAEKTESYKCKMCTHKNVCRGTELPAITCGTCANSDIVEGEVTCAIGQSSNPCNKHIYNPLLVKNLGYKLLRIDPDLRTIFYEGFSMSANGGDTLNSAMFGQMLLAGKLELPKDEDDEATATND